MKEPLFFHVQPKVEQATVMFADGSMAIMDIFEDIRPHTYCIKKSEKQDNLLYVGYAVTHKNDQFNKDKGRSLAIQRCNAAELGFDARKEQTDDRIHDSVKKTIDQIVERAAFLLDMKGPVEFITRADSKGKKVFTKMNVIN